MISSTSLSPRLQTSSPHNASEIRYHLQSSSIASRTPPARPATGLVRMETTSTLMVSGQPSSSFRDASTQYSPPKLGSSLHSPTPGKRKSRSPPSGPWKSPQNPFKLAQKPAAASVTPSCPLSDGVPISNSGGTASSERPRAPPKIVKCVPARYELCDSADLVRLISLMLMELIHFNDNIPLADGSLTRFHSRTPPSISVHDYLQRLTTHATLSPPILLSMVYYIDRMCALYPTFTISSLTVHRFLIASVTVASKGLSDSFWTNNTYARVGGVSLKELALLELEFLRRVEWRIVPKPEVLVDYYRSLVERSEEFELESQDTPA